MIRDINLEHAPRRSSLCSTWEQRRRSLVDVHFTLVTPEVKQEVTLKLLNDAIG